MPKAYLKWGDWNAWCDICGTKHKASELKDNWKHQKVCPKCWEIRHPQELIRVPKDDPHVPWARPEGEDQFIFVCYIWGTSAYADLAEADCAQADYTPQSFSVLWEMKYGVPFPDTTFP